MISSDAHFDWTQKPPKPVAVRRRFVILVTIFVLIIASVVGLVIPATQRVREAASRMTSSGQLCQTGLAIHNYDIVHGHLPPQAICDQQGNNLLSWRVAILPYMEQDNLYARFKLDEPWDSPHNIALIAEMPKSYALPMEDNTKGLTHFKVFAGKHTAFEMMPDEDSERLRSKWDIGALMKSPRGHSNVILCVQAGDPVVWTKPEDIDYDPDSPLPKMKTVYSGGFLAVMGDGHVATIRKGTKESTWRAYIKPMSTSKETVD